MSSRTALSQRQTALAALQTAFWEKSRREGLAVAKIKEVTTPISSHANLFVCSCFLLQGGVVVYFGLFLYSLVFCFCGVEGVLFVV